MSKRRSKHRRQRSPAQSAIPEVLRGVVSEWPQIEADVGRASTHVQEDELCEHNWPVDMDPPCPDCLFEDGLCPHGKNLTEEDCADCDVAAEADELDFEAADFSGAEHTRWFPWGREGADPRAETECDRVGHWWPGWSTSQIGDVQTCQECGEWTRTRVKGGWRHQDGTFEALGGKTAAWTPPQYIPSTWASKDWSSKSTYAVQAKPYVYRECLVFDFDGTLHPGVGYQAVYGEVDTEGIERAHERGEAVAIMTCSVLSQVGAALRKAGYTVIVDQNLTRSTWNGGDDGKTILVTARKIDGRAFVDDRAIHHTHGGSWGDVFAQVDTMQEAARERAVARETARKAEEARKFHPCVPGGHRHWGASGAAGLLVFTEWRGERYVLLGKRGDRTQQGGTWSTFGGAIEQGEDAFIAACREAKEEVKGLHVLDRVSVGYVSPCEHGCGWTYTTYLVVPSGPVSPRRLPRVRVKDHWEVPEIAWCRLPDVEEMHLHPAFARVWPELRATVRATDLSADPVPA